MINPTVEESISEPEKYKVTKCDVCGFGRSDEPLPSNFTCEMPNCPDKREKL